MWLLTEIGFFSIVEKPYDRPRGTLTVRSRAKEDLYELGKKYLPTLNEIAEDERADYRFRATAKRQDVVAAVADITRNIKYPNFKDHIYNNQGSQREEIYSRVWTALKQIQDERS